MITFRQLQALTLRLRRLATEGWETVYWDLIDPLVTHFRRYEVKESVLHPAERRAVWALADRIRKGYRQISTSAFVLALIGSFLLPLGPSPIGIFGAAVRIATFVLALWCVSTWFSATDRDMRWFQLAMRVFYLTNRGFFENQGTLPRVFSPYQVYIPVPVHLRFTRPELKLARVWLPLPAGGKIKMEARCCTRRRILTIRELRRTCPNLEIRIGPRP